MTPAYDPGPGDAKLPPDGSKTWLDYRLKHQHVNAVGCWQCRANKHVRAEFAAKSAEIARLNEENNQYVKEHTDDTLLIARLEARLAELEALTPDHVNEMDEHLARMEARLAVLEAQEANCLRNEEKAMNAQGLMTELADEYEAERDEARQRLARIAEIVGTSGVDPDDGAVVLVKEDVDEILALAAGEEAGGE